MSTPVLTQNSAPTEIVRPAGLTGLKVTLPRVIRSEWIKLVTVRSTVITVVAAVLAIIGFGALAASVRAGDVVPPNGGGGGPFAAADPTGVSLAGVTLAQLVFAVVGVLVITNEFSNGMIRSYLAAVPKRLPVLWAKVIVVGVVVSVTGMIATLAAFVLGQSILGDSGVGLGDDGVLRAVLGSGLYLGGIAVIAVAVGGLLRHTAGSIAILFAFLLVIPGLIGVLLPDSWADAISPYLPSNAGAAFTSVTPADTLLSSGAGVAVFVGWVVVLLGAAAWRVKRQDA